MSKLAVLKATVHGRVQGVYFRAFVERHAQELGLTGYVRNTPEGMVEVYAEGDREQLMKLMEFLKQGPPRARVNKLEETWSEYCGKYPDFRIKYG
ncbi:MAG: acylphosphatase [Chloroflexi bacterium]|nr:acylphosphatase [Chloroflexota bacterium]